MKESSKIHRHPATNGLQGAIAVGAAIGIEFTNLDPILLDSAGGRIGTYAALLYTSSFLAGRTQDQVLKLHGRNSLKKDSRKSSEVLSDEEVITREKDKWRNLGINIGDISLPNMVTPEVRRKLRALSMDLLYIPQLNYEERQRLSYPFFSKEPKRYENDSYWRPQLPNEPTHIYYRTGGIEEPLNILFPDDALRDKQKTGRIQNEWIAIETSEQSSLTHALGLTKRENLPWLEIQKRIKKLEQPLLSTLQIQGNAEVRLPDMNEWNIFAGQHEFLRRYKAGYHIKEWTSSVINLGGEGQNRVNPIICSSEHLRTYSTFNKYDNAKRYPISFRLAIGFKK